MENNEKAIIEVEKLNFAYDDKLILKDISFRVEQGDFVGVIGANGSGKSTLVKLMIKILEPLSGRITLLGKPIEQFSDWSHVAYVSQKANAFNGSFPATVEEIVGSNLYSEVGLFRRLKVEHKQKINEALEKVCMLDYKKRLIGQLSGGQQQRVFIARALVSQPKILFLDEPTVGIDAKAEDQLYCLLAKINKEYGLTIMMVTHDVGTVTVHANRVLCLGEQGFVDHYPEDGVTSEFISELYGYQVHLHSHGHKESTCCAEETRC